MLVRRVLAAAAVLAPMITVIAGGPAAAMVAPDVDLTETIAAEGDTVGFSGQSDFGGPSDCEVQVAGQPVETFDCSVGIKGEVAGSFTVPPAQGPGVAKVVVCLPGCDVPDGPSWVGTGLLEIGVRVPEVSRGSLAEAEAALGEVGLVAAADPETADAESTVEQQNPGPGEVVTAGSTVKLTLSAPAPTLVEVPDVLEHSGQDARDTLRNVGFQPEMIGDLGGTVFRQDPAPGDLRPSGTTVRSWLQPPPPSPSPSTHEAASPDEVTPEVDTPSRSRVQPETPSQVETPTSGEPPTSAAAANPTEPSTVTRTDQAEVATVDDPTDWRGPGSTMSFVLLAAAAAFVVARAATGRRRGARWARHHLRVTARTVGTSVAATRRGTRGDHDHSVQVDGRCHEPAFTVREH